LKIKPKPLKKGDKIGIIAPAGPAPEEKLKKGIKVLEDMGFSIVLGRSVFQKRGYLAGNDELRLEDIHRMFLNTEIKGIICMRGGYGTPRLLERIDYNLISKNPKAFIGYSDITALHLAFVQKANMVTFHGPMVTSDLAADDFNEYTARWLIKALMGKEPLGKLENPEGEPPVKSIVPGKVCGEIIGGNLSLIASTIGTPFEIDTRNKILMIEEIGEEPYRIDRMLTQLKLAGKLDDALGFVIGECIGCGASDPENSLDLEEVIDDIIVPLNKPSIAGLKCGHGRYKLTLPLGIKAELDAAKAEISIIETAFS